MKGDYIDMKKPLNNRYVILLIALIILAVPYYIFIYKPMFKAVTELKNKNAFLKEERTKIEDYIKNSAQYQKELENINNKLKDFDKKLDFNGAAPPVLGDFKYDNGIIINEMDTKPSEDVKNSGGINLKKISVEVTFTTADYNAAKNYFKYIEGKNDRLYIIKSISMTPVFKSVGDKINLFDVQSYDCKMKADAYYYGTANK